MSDGVEFLRRLPKAELHCHLEGAVPAATLLELARKNGVPLPAERPEDVYRIALDEQAFLREMESVPSWVLQAFARKYQRPVATTADLYALGQYEAFLERFDAACHSLVDADDFSRAAYDSLVEAADTSNVRYREMLFHPMNHPGVGYRTMVDGLVDGIRAAEADRGIVGRLIPSITRDHAAAAATALVEEILAYRPPEVVGLASDYDEEHIPAFYEAYRMAAKAGLPGTAHAGEYGNAQSVAECIDVLGCRRIDHGYSVVDDPELVARAREQRIHFAAIFSWSVAIHDTAEWPLGPPELPPARKVASPVGDMLAAGLSVSLGSDDPAFEGFGDLATEYAWAAGHLDLGRGQMIELCLGAVDAAWLDDTEKAAMRRSFDAEIAELGATPAP
ncbi:MAG: hypothetical protein QOH58_1032 [Thermoleophilaceae bacterium]|jgi:adenosine deaminase|nr:hypothetical protein [Thermoleophilaceae bacterium]